MLRDLERRDQRLTDGSKRELLKIQLGCLAQIRQRLFDRFAFGGRAGFRIVGREKAVASSRELLGFHAPFVFSVGDLQPRKNQIGLIS